MTDLETDYSTRIFEYPAAVIIGVQETLRQLAISRGVFDQKTLEQYSPYFFGAEISNNRLDSHYTQMAPSSLRNYAADADEGVTFLYSHDNSEIVGQSMTGKFVNAQGNSIARVLADFYTVPDLQLGTVSSNQIIRGIDTKILRAVSVGFYGGEWICSICGRDMWADWDCDHIPGWPEEVEGDGKVETQMCTATIENAHLAETSAVYKGSTPGAMIEKASLEATRGRLKTSVRQLIELRYRIHLPEKRVQIPGNSTPKEQAAMPKPSTTRENDTASGATTSPTPDPATATAPTPEAPVTEAPAAETAAAPPPATTASAGETPAPAPTAGAGEEGRGAQTIDTGALIVMVRGLNNPTLLRDVQALISENERLRPLADDGRQYRNALVEEMILAGVRAHGATFKQETYRGIAAASTIPTIIEMRDDFDRLSHKQFPGGRQTQDATETEATPKTATPRAAFKTPR